MSDKPPMSWNGDPILPGEADPFCGPFVTPPAPRWGIEYDWGVSFTYNGSRVASFEKHGHATVMFCKPSKAELAKELREFALAANEAATMLEMG